MDLAHTPDQDTLRSLDTLELRVAQISSMQQLSLGTIEELRHHASDIAQVVAWLHRHAPDRFDPTGITTMGGLITSIFNEWMALRLASQNTLRSRIGRAIDRMWYAPPNPPKENGD